jgi:two-component system CheB/CheR fusion protein
MDMQMPEMDGYQAVRLLREEGYDAPIVALTSHTMVGERAKCLRAGCDEYATKPIDKDAFLKITFRFLRSGGRRRYRLAR